MSTTGVARPDLPPQLLGRGQVLLRERLDVGRLADAFETTVGF
ncbi:hypothetical protein ACFXC8_39980 [Streptomyces sp. NPDC059441]